MNNLVKYSNLWLMLLADTVLVVACFYLAYLFRFEFDIPGRELAIFKATLPWLLGVKITTFAVFHLYRGMWRYTSVGDLVAIVKAVAVSSSLMMLGVLMIQRFSGYPRSIFLIDGALTLVAIGGLRALIRVYFARQQGVHVLFPVHGKKAGEDSKDLVIVGAGDAGEKALREIRNNPRLRYRVVGFVDDDPLKLGRTIHDVPVIDHIQGLKRAVESLQADEVLIAIPSAGPRMRDIMEACKECGAPFKMLPGLGELIDGRVSVKALRDVDYQDLLGRPQVEGNTEDVRAVIENKRILVTGGGGSIGSELVRRIVLSNPQNIVIRDASEVNLYSIQMELKQIFGYQRYTPVLGSIQNGAFLDRLFTRYRPQVVFHAAAYKHVGMMERNPWQAIHNNIRGSSLVMETAVRHGVDRFVLVSTDKAVRPTNVMGASKRVAELVLQSHLGSQTAMMAVRFGNVVGSSGSVIPLFRKQIAMGGPVTVSHPEVTRFFMTIPEACQLILEAGALGTGGEIFILEMGTPVRILDMARDLIRLSGKEPDRDIEIVFKGLDPGEKLYEELITEGEGIVPTDHEKIMVLRPDGLWDGYGDQDGFRMWLTEGISELYRLADAQDGAGIRRQLKALVPEYQPMESECML
ncbi:MAG: nucleoside-diphosphate sugar epimerase/dehydratase [Deltaproteobacteria bacterium]|nr:nucleoside-diphosphate sugar epimerase/dehydratase [Deltaproteobacteria bacterium]